MITSIFKLRLSNHRVPGSNLTVDASLVNQIKNYGQLSPVIVRSDPENKGGFEILQNYETWLVLGRLKVTTVEIRIIENVSDIDVIRMVNSSKPNAIAEAEYFAALINCHAYGEIQQLAEAHFMSRSKLSHMLRLLKLPAKIQEMISRGQLGAGHGRALLVLESDSNQISTAKLAIKNEWSVRKTEHYIKTLINVQTKRNDIKLLEIHLTKIIGCTVTIDEGGGEIKINYSGNPDVLEGITNKLLRV